MYKIIASSNRHVSILIRCSQSKRDWKSRNGINYSIGTVLNCSLDIRLLMKSIILYSSFGSWIFGVAYIIRSEEMKYFYEMTSIKFSF